jgi:hypothetical protein
MKPMFAEHTLEISLYEADDHEKLVALCEAGFIYGCRAAIKRPE